MSGQDIKTEKFICEAKKVHADKYDYSQTIYELSNKKLTIICPEHGPFLMRASCHLYSKRGCQKCSANTRHDKQKISRDDWMRMVRNVHGDSYDYSKTAYKGFNEKIIIICRSHGEFEQRAHVHLLRGTGCPKCNNRRSLTTEKFITWAMTIYGNQFDYSETEYINNTTNVIIKCQLHGEF